MRCIYARPSLFLACSLALALAPLAGCEGRGGEIVQLFAKEQPGEILGTARDDLWVTRDHFGPIADIKYFDGVTERSVLVPIWFSGQRPSLAATARGEVWIGGLHRENTPGSTAKVLLGKLDSQGNFEDHSNDFPVGPEHPYKSLILHGCEGELLVDITLEASPKPTHKLYSYTAEEHIEIPIPESTSPLEIYMVGARDYFFLGLDPRYIRFHYVDGNLRTEDPPPPYGYKMIRSKGHRWAYSNDKGSSVYSYDGHSFHEVPIDLHFPVADSRERPTTARRLGIVPQSDTTFTWVGVETEGGYWGGITNHKVIARHYNGNTLSREDIILSDTVECAYDSPDHDQECIDISYLRHLAVLEDGSILVDNEADYKPGLLPKTFVITVDDEH